MARPLNRLTGVVLGCLVALLATACGVSGSATPGATSGDFPAKGKKVKFVIASAAGTSSDTTNRLLLRYAEKELGTQFDIVNMPGAATQIGDAAVANAAPDGYTLGHGALPSAIGVYLDKNAGAKFNGASFTKICNIMFDPGATAVTTDSPYKTIDDLVQAAKESPGTIRVGAGGHLSRQELDWTDLQLRSGAKFRLVAAGSVDGMALLLGHSLDVDQESLGDFNSLLQGKKVRILGLWTEKRNPDFPDIPTMKEQGYDMISGNSRGIIAPAGVPPKIVKTLADAFKRAYDNPDFQAELKKLGGGLGWMGTADYTKFWNDSEMRARELLKAAGAEVPN